MIRPKPKPRDRTSRHVALPFWDSLRALRSTHGFDFAIGCLPLDPGHCVVSRPA